MKEDFDAVVVGGGIAGSYLAGRLSRRGVRVLLLEKSKSFKEDSGIVSRRFFRFLPRSLAEHEVRCMQFVSPSGKKISLKAAKPFAWLASRHKVNQFLRKRCNISYERVSGIRISGSGAEVATDENVYACKIIAGCDGAYSLVRRSLGIRDPRMYFGVLAREKPRAGDIAVYLNKYYSPDFFAWHIPQTGEWGTISQKRPMEYFDFFRKSEGFAPGKTAASPIPIGFVKARADRCILVGEAAGQTKPLTGGGYIFGLECAKIAADAIEKCIASRRFDEPFIASAYDYWKGRFAKEIYLQLAARRLYRRLTNAQLERIFDAIGPYIEKLEVRDYDLLSRTLLRLPKLRLLRAFAALFV